MRRRGAVTLVWTCPICGMEISAVDKDELEWAKKEHLRLEHGRS